MKTYRSDPVRISEGVQTLTLNGGSSPSKRITDTVRTALQAKVRLWEADLIVQALIQIARLRQSLPALQSSRRAPARAEGRDSKSASPLWQIVSRMGPSPPLLFLLQAPPRPTGSLPPLHDDQAGSPTPQLQNHQALQFDRPHNRVQLQISRRMRSSRCWLSES